VENGYVGNFGLLIAECGLNGKNRRAFRFFIPQSEIRNPQSK
jgi:hypothetical protein